MYHILVISLFTKHVMHLKHLVFLSLVKKFFKTIVLDAILLSKMERYRILKVVGDGTYGIVSKAVNRSTGEVVAIKKMKEKFFTWES